MEIGGLKKDFEVWIPFQDARVRIRHMRREDVREMTRTATVLEFDLNHQKQERFDGLKFDVLLGRAAVRGWEGFTVDGKDYPYSPEHCEELMRGWALFARFVNEVCTDLQALQAEEEKEKAKNSSRISGTE